MNEIFYTYAENAFDYESKIRSLTWKRERYEYNFKIFFPKDSNARLLDIGSDLGKLLITEKD